jgi:hypothetical protein
MIRGRVTDEAGNCIAGAALRIDGQMVFTDEAGRFFTRLKEPKPRLLEVVPENFLAPGRYEQVSPEQTVVPAVEERAGEVSVVLRLVRPPFVG